MTTTVQRLLDDKGALLFPGVHDALSAKIAEQAGFEMAFVTGYGASASQLGKPDMGFLNQSDLCDIVSRLSQATPMPLIADADTGYGNALNVEHTIRRLIHAGAKGCFLEDQQWPKRCGHMSGKQIINRDEYIDKIRAAVAARDGKDFFIVARTDALAVVGMEEAQARMAEARTAGADGFFIEAPADEAQLRHIAATAPKPLVANMIQGGKTPLLPLTDLRDIGYALVLYPLAGLYAAAHALAATYRQLRDGGFPGDQPIVDFDTFNSLIGAEEWLEKARQWR
jgi:methylisocitrate lyase